MKCPTTLPLLPIVFLAAAQAGEVTIEPRPLVIEKSFTATAMPDESGVAVMVEPKAWQDFQIVKLAAHGAKVSKGETIVAFDTEEIDKKLTDSRRAMAAGELTLAQAELDLKNLLETSPHRLEAYRRAAAIAKEENAYFVSTRRKAAEETAKMELEHKKQALSNQEEELRQLTKMYAADEATEETEEIILTRQKDAVVTAKFAVRMEELDYQRTMNVTLPREAVTLANNERDTAIALAKVEADTPRTIELKKLELEGLKTSRTREKQALAELEHDRTLFEIKAAADGYFYHGPIEHGRWSPNPELLKTLVKHGRPPVNRTIATLVPATAKLALVAFVDEVGARALAAEQAGTATLTGRDEVEIPVKLTAVAATPGADGNYRVDVSVSWPKDLTPVAGSTAQARIVTYQQDKALSVPTKALSRDGKNWTVEVKLTDGKTEKRVVKRGRASNERTEILGGLEVGQVVVTP